ncbi:hypothetical protein CBL_20905, partial [Carabus blaptoides fortunei]
ERGTLVSAEICCNAAGQFIPPLLVFPRVRTNPLFEIGLPPESKVVCHPSGWMQKDIFVTWFVHFISFAKPTATDPVLLLFDGHSTHTKNLELIELARENNVHIIVIPPHTSHRLQPLDVSFMFPLSSYYGQEIKFWLRNNPGKVVTIHEISKLFGAAFQRAATIQNAVSGFKNTGIYPYNPNIFPDDLFQPAETTDNLNPTEIRQRSPQPGPSVASDIISPCDIFPVPKSTVIRKKSQKRGKTTILTSTPELEALKAGHLTPKLPDKQTVKRNLFHDKVQKKKAVPTKKKKQIIVDSTDSDES